MGKRRKLLIGKLLIELALAAALTSTSSAARAANIISFVAIGDGSVQTDVQVDFDVSFQFDEATVGGGFDVLFSPAVFSFKSFVFNPSLGDDLAFRLKPLDDQSDPLYTIAFGQFAGLTSGRVGTLTLLGKQNVMLTPVPTGPEVLGATNNLLPAGSFISAVTFDPMLVEYRGLFVPEPGTLLLVGTGLLGFARLRRQRA